jgi:arylsulfatase A-like enzyme
MSRKDLADKYTKKRQDLGLQPKWGQEGSRQVRLVQEHAVYAGMVEAMDSAVGKVLGTLRTLGLDDNTVVIFMSDNGGLSTSEGHPTSNVPLRAGKGWLYEGGIREPMIVKWPGRASAGSVCGEPVVSTDFYPTLLELAGLPLKPKQHADGRSFVPLLKGQTMTRGPIFWHYPHYGNQGGSPGGAVRDGDWKLIECFESGRPELYNLRADIGETNNLAEQYPDKVKILHRKLKDFRDRTEAKMPTPNPAYRPPLEK